MALTNYYVDPAIAGNSGTGTSGDPFGDLQYCLNSITRNSTDGDQINIKAGTAELLAAALTLTTYGTPTTTAPLVMRGYTSSANDGGRGAVNCNGYTFIASTPGHIILIDLDFSGAATAANGCIVLGDYCQVWNCSVENTSGYAVGINSGGVVAGCYLTNCVTGVSLGRGGGSGAHAIANYILNSGARTTTTGIIAGVNSSVLENIVKLGSSGKGITANSSSIVKNNSVFSAASTGAGVEAGSSTYRWIILNNIIEGFSGAGGVGLNILSTNEGIYGHNAYYNNTTNESVASGEAISLGNNDTLSGSAFVNAGSADFDINGTVTGVTEDGWPSSFQGATSTTPKNDKGASQAGAGAGSSGGGPVFGGMVVR